VFLWLGLCIFVCRVIVSFLRHGVICTLFLSFLVSVCWGWFVVDRSNYGKVSLSYFFFCVLFACFVIVPLPLLFGLLS